MRAPLLPRFLLAALAVGFALTTSNVPAAAAASCDTGNFDAWLADLKTDAAAKGISQSAITSGLNGVTLDKAVITRDHSQAVFNQTFEQFSGRMVPPRLTRGSDMLKRYGSVLGRVEETYGVPVDEICEGIRYGVRKVNIDTDIRLAMTGAMRRLMANKPDEFDPRKFLSEATKAAKDVCKARFEAFGSAGQASRIKPIPLARMCDLYAAGELRPVVH